jgi:hypothetical protein
MKKVTEGKYDDMSGVLDGYGSETEILMVALLIPGFLDEGGKALFDLIDQIFAVLAELVRLHDSF